MAKDNGHQGFWSERGWVFTYPGSTLGSRGLPWCRGRFQRTHSRVFSPSTPAITLFITAMQLVDAAMGSRSSRWSGLAAPAQSHHMPTPETRDGAILEHLLHFMEKTRHQGDPSAVCQRDYGPSMAPPLSQEAERRALHAHGSDLWRGLVEAQQRMSAQPRYDHATMGTSTTNSVDMEHAISCAQSVLLWSQVRSSCVSHPARGGQSHPALPSVARRGVSCQGCGLSFAEWCCLFIFVWNLDTCTTLLQISA